MPIVASVVTAPSDVCRCTQPAAVVDMDNMTNSIPSDPRTNTTPSPLPRMNPRLDTRKMMFSADSSAE